MEEWEIEFEKYCSHIICSNESSNNILIMKQAFLAGYQVTIKNCLNKQRVREAINKNIPEDKYADGEGLVSFEEETKALLRELGLEIKND